MKAIANPVLATVVVALAAPALAQPAAPALDVPYVPTPHDVAEAMLSAARVKPTDTVYDLGCGDGRLVILAAERYRARGVGVDLDPERISEARANARRAAVTDRVAFHQGDLFDIDLSPATVLTLYLLSDVNLRLRPRILAQLRPGARVVSHDFDMGDWEPDTTIARGEHMVYGWVIPAAVAGVWRWDSPLGRQDAPFEVRLEQQHQKLTGKLLAGAGVRSGRTRLIQSKVTGEELSFTIVAANPGQPVTMRYRGTVDGARAVGMVTIDDGPAAAARALPWTATAELAPAR